MAKNSAVKKQTKSKIVEPKPVKKVQVVKKVEVEGVAYDRRGGAKCPACRTPRCNVTTTGPWEDKIRIRYHCCRRCGTQFKSIEED